MTLEEILKNPEYLCAAIHKHLARGEIESARFCMERLRLMPSADTTQDSPTPVNMRSVNV